MSCGYSRLNKDGGTLEVKIEEKGDGVRGTVEGGEQSRAKVQGRFEDR